METFAFLNAILVMCQYFYFLSMPVRNLNRVYFMSLSVEGAMDSCLFHQRYQRGSFKTNFEVFFIIFLWRRSVSVMVLDKLCRRCRLQPEGDQSRNWLLPFFRVQSPSRNARSFIFKNGICCLLSMM